MVPSEFQFTRVYSSPGSQNTSNWAVLRDFASFLFEFLFKPAGFQVLYQVGVFISRSSVRFLELPIWAIYLLPILQVTIFLLLISSFQTANLGFFIFEAIYWFIPNIGIIFAIIVLEGLLGGAAYVNTYNYAHKTVRNPFKNWKRGNFRSPPMLENILCQ